MPTERPAQSSLKTRAFSLTMLVGTATLLGYLAEEAYRAATDSFVAPIILSPDNDMIVASKLKVAEFYVEREKSIAERDAIDSDVTAIDESIVRLTALRQTTSTSLDWTSEVNSHQLSAAKVDLGTLDQAHALLLGMIEQQKGVVKDAKANMESGISTRADFDKERQTLDQLQLAVIENERTRFQSAQLAQEATFAQRSLANAHGAPMMPERLMREEQTVRIELELAKLESDRRTKVAERRLLVDKLQVLDGLESDLKSRPVFRAVGKSMDVAFVPYTQMGEMRAGFAVYDCVWGLVHCKKVGTVAEIVAGEVILPDPWGNQARGQYVVLDLVDHAAAMSKVLRVRDEGAATPVVQPPPPARLSSR